MKRILILQLLILLTFHSYSQNNIYEIFALEFANNNWRAVASEVAVGAVTKDCI